MKAVFFLLFLIALSCSQHPGSHQQTKLKLIKLSCKVLPTRKNKMPDSVKNEYLKIALTCAYEFDSCRFNEGNYHYFDLDPNHQMQCFVFWSDSGGSCGYTVDVFRKKDNVYESLPIACATSVERTKQVFNGFYVFEFDIRDGEKYVVKYNTKLFKSEVVSVKGVEIDELKMILEHVSYDPGLSLKGYFEESPPNGEVSIKKVRLGNNVIAELYQFQSNSNVYHFYFLNKKLLFHFNDSDARSYVFSKSKTNGMYNIIVTSTDYVLKGKEFVPILLTYVYSEKEGKYVDKTL